MQLTEIRKELGGVVFESIRADDNNYFEAVMAQAELVKLIGILEKFFSSTISPSENKLPAHIEKEINDLGGIFAGQSLYFNNQGDNILFAMLWPWQDGQHTTIKIVQK